MDEIKCDVCNKTIAFTNRRISKTKNDFLKSTKMTSSQKYGMIQKRKLIYCPACYHRGVTAAMDEIEKERMKKYE